MNNITKIIYILEILKNKWIFEIR